MIRMLAAIDSSRGLAKEGQIPWDIPRDQKRYKSLMATKGGNVLVGKTTYLQMRGLLDNLNVYLATKEAMDIPGLNKVTNLEDFLSGYKGELWILGGGSIFNTSIKYADELILTEINGDYQCDIFFPEYQSNFEEISREGPLEENGYRFSFVDYKRKQSN